MVGFAEGRKWTGQGYDVFARLVRDPPYPAHLQPGV